MPGASEAMTVLQLGASGSVTVTLVRVTLPVLVISMVKVTTAPGSAYCRSGVLAMSMAGCATMTWAGGEFAGGGGVTPGGGVPVTEATLVKLVSTLATVHW